MTTLKYKSTYTQAYAFTYSYKSILLTIDQILLIEISPLDAYIYNEWVWSMGAVSNTHFLELLFLIGRGFVSFQLRGSSISKGDVLPGETGWGEEDSGRGNISTSVGKKWNLKLYKIKLPFSIHSVCSPSDRRGLETLTRKTWLHTAGNTQLVGVAARGTAGEPYTAIVLRINNY